MNYAFSKAERLCSKKRIEQLFAGDSRSFSAYPLRAVYTETEPPHHTTSSPHHFITSSLLISVSKRHFKHAVDRNRVKRLIREAYRLNKGLLLNHLPEDRHLDLAFIWMSDELSDFPTVESKVKNLLQRIVEQEKESI